MVAIKQPGNLMKRLTFPPTLPHPLFANESVSVLHHDVDAVLPA